MTGAASRNKGSAFERLVARELYERLGITFKRDLDQYRQRDRGDLLTDDPAFPFVIECKHHDKPALPSWQRQAVTAALTEGKIAAVIYRITGQPIRVSLPFAAFGDGWGNDLWATTSLDGFCFVAREIMAQPGIWVPNDYTTLHRHIVGDVE